MKLFRSTWFAFGAGMVVFWATLALLWRPQPFPQAQAREAAAGAVGSPKASWNFFNPEIDQLIAELKEQREALAKREKELNDLALRLQNERDEINTVTQRVHELQVTFDRNVLRLKDEETTNLKRLAKIYSSMTPEGATVILNELEDDNLTKILMEMKESEAAPILENLAQRGPAEAKRAAVISDRMRMFLREPSTKSKP